MSTYNKQDDGNKVGLKGKGHWYNTAGVIIHLPSDGKKLIMDYKDDLKQYIIKKNESKCHQMEGYCPLVDRYQLKILGYTTTTDTTQKIASGTFNLTRHLFLPAKRTFLKICARPKAFILHDQNYLSYEEYCRV